MNMDPKTVEQLEEKIETAIAEVVVGVGLTKLPLLPCRRTLQLSPNRSRLRHRATTIRARRTFPGRREVGP